MGMILQNGEDIPNNFFELSSSPKNTFSYFKELERSAKGYLHPIPVQYIFVNKIMICGVERQQSSAELCVFCMKIYHCSFPLINVFELII